MKLLRSEFLAPRKQWIEPVEGDLFHEYRPGHYRRWYESVIEVEIEGETVRSSTGHTWIEIEAIGYARDAFIRHLKHTMRKEIMSAIEQRIFKGD